MARMRGMGEDRASQHQTTQFFRARLLALAVRRRASELLFAPSSGAPFTHGSPHQRATCAATDSHGPEFIYVTAGEARVISPYHTFILRPRRLLVLERGAEHYEFPAEPGAPYEMFWCTLEGTHAVIGAHSFRPPDIYQGYGFSYLEGMTDLESIAGAIVSELRNQHWGWQEAVHGLCKYLSRVLVRRLPRAGKASLRARESPAIAVDPHTWRVIRTTLLYCERHYQAEIRLGEVAKVVGYSPGHLSHLFSTHLGYTFTEHMQRLRMEAGRRLLETTEWSIQEIARRVGYQESSNFSHAFTRVLGLSPTAYREHQRGL